MISKEEIAKLAQLSRIELTDAEMEQFQKDISGILDYVAQIAAVENGGDPERSEGGKLVPPHHNIMRDDVPYEETSQMKAAREDILKALPRREGDYAVVRKIIQKDE